MDTQVALTLLINHSRLHRCGSSFLDLKLPTSNEFSSIIGPFLRTKKIVMDAKARYSLYQSLLGTYFDKVKNHSQGRHAAMYRPNHRACLVVSHEKEIIKDIKPLCPEHQAIIDQLWATCKEDGKTDWSAKSIALWIAAKGRLPVYEDHEFRQSAKNKIFYASSKTLPNPSRAARKVLGLDVELDVKNALPTILERMARDISLDLPVLFHYNKNREALLAARPGLKKQVLCALFGAKKRWPSKNDDLVDEIRREAAVAAQALCGARTIKGIIYNEAGVSKPKSNNIFSDLSFILGAPIKKLQEFILETWKDEVVLLAFDAFFFKNDKLLDTIADEVYSRFGLVLVRK